ncbi:hNH endonuclease [Escherichia coli]|nr:hNH endonuclease [Escherichia coli]
MGSNIIELAKLGHERAAELKASSGAVDVRSLAQLISDLATQLEVQFVRSTNMAVQLANAESKCRELAAENAALKSFGDKLYSMYKGLETSGGGFHDEQSIPYQQAALDAAISAFEEIKTPATDAFLAEVRAHDLNAFIRHHSAELDAHIKNGGEQFDEKSVRIRDIIVSARLFREQIRQEAAQ